MGGCRTFLAGLVCLLLAGCPPAPAGFDTEALVWPDGAPGARGSRRHDEPRLFYYFPDPAIATDTAVVVASGGSYGHHGGLRPEGVPTARWLTSLGITAIIVRYRVGEFGGYDHRAFLADGARAVQIVRAQAEELGVAPDRIGMIGYSAGGHLSASLAARCPEHVVDGEQPPSAVVLPDDALSRVSCRPDFAAALYPVVTLNPPYVYERSRRNLLGDQKDAPPPELVSLLSVEEQVSATTAPLFVVHSELDTKVDHENSVLLYDALVAAGAPNARLLLAQDGRHGVALARDPDRMPQMSQWPEQFIAWAQALGKLDLK